MTAPPRPARQVCPLCSRDNLVLALIGPMLWSYTCENPRHPGGSFTWRGTATERINEPAMEGRAADLGLYEDLPRCLVPGEPFIEYGVVEHRFSQLRPEVYQELIDDYSHTRIERNKPFTASVFIALALDRLSKVGDVLKEFGPATGYWAYNEVISYWALPPGPAGDAEKLTWEQYAQQQNLDAST